MPLSRRFPGTTRDAGTSQPAEVLVIDTAGDPVDLSATGGDESQPTTATVTSVASSTSVVTLLAANSSRRGAMIHNDSKRVLHVKFGTGASLTDYSVKVEKQEMYELPFPIYTGILTGIWNMADGAAKVTELT